MAEFRYSHGPWSYHPLYVFVTRSGAPGQTVIRGRCYRHVMRRDGVLMPPYVEFDDGNEMSEGSFRFLVDFGFPKPDEFNIRGWFDNRIVEALYRFREDNALMGLDQLKIALRLSEFCDRNDIPQYR